MNMKTKVGSILPALSISLITWPSWAAPSGKPICDLIMQMQSVFMTLRTLAFVGAGFVLAKYAWEFISTGKVGGKEGIEGLKTIGIPMIIGFFLLFSVGVFLTFLMNGRVVECDVLQTGW